MCQAKSVALLLRVLSMAGWHANVLLVRKSNKVSGAHNMMDFALRQQISLICRTIVRAQKVIARKLHV